MTNVIFAGLPNVADTATITLAGGVTPSLPATNMQNRQLSQVARINSVATADTKITLDLGEPKLLQVFALLKNNFSYFSKLRILVSANSDMSSPLYDSGFVYAIPETQPGVVDGWGAFGWGSTIPFAQLKQITVNTVHVAPAAYIARYVRFEIDDTTNPDGFLDIARCIVSDLTEAMVNPDYGMKLGYVDRSTDSEAENGTIYTDRRKAYRKLSMTFSNMSEGWVMAKFFNNIDRDKGTAGDFLVIPQPDKPEQLNNQAIYGKLTTTSDVEFTAYGLFTKGIEIRELI